MNNRLLGIVGSAMLIIGIFLPIISIAGFISVSAFDAIRAAPISESYPGILLLLCGIAGLILALTNRYRALIGPGIISLGILVFTFIKMKSAFANAPEEAGEFAQQMAQAVSIGWGLYVMAIGAILMIVAGVMKNTVPVMNPGYGAPPPPPPPYTPGR